MASPFIVVTVGLMLLLASPLAAATETNAPFDTSAIHALLDVIDAIMEAHPDYESERARIAALDGNARSAALAEKRDANALVEVNGSVAYNGCHGLY